MKIKEKNRLKLISLLVALLLFISVNENFKNFSVLGGNSSGDTTSWVSDVPVEVEYDREKLYVVGVPNTLSVKLVGTSSKIQKETVAKNFKVKIDLKNAQIGEDQKIKPTIEGLDRDVEGVVEPSTLTVSIREKVTKEFKVTPVVKKERLLIGYEIATATVSNETVKISGADESIKRIHEVRAESDAKTKINKNLKEEAKLVAYDSDYNKIEDINIEPSTTVMTLELKTVEKEVPLVINKIGTLPMGYELVSVVSDVEKVTVRAENETVLDGISELYVDVDMSDVDEDVEEKVNLKVYSKSDGQISVDTPTIKVTIKTKKK